MAQMSWEMLFGRRRTASPAPFVTSSTRMLRLCLAQQGLAASTSSPFLAVVILTRPTVTPVLVMERRGTVSMLKMTNSFLLLLAAIIRTINVAIVHLG